MTNYNQVINVVSNRTGLSTHVIRIGEKRYGRDMFFTASHHFPPKRSAEYY